MIELKTGSELDNLRAAGRAVAATLRALQQRAQVGTRVDELDALARQVLDEAGAVPLLLGDQPRSAPRPFPGVISCSVNDVVAHGQPSRYRLADGDVLSLACAARLDGMCAQAAVTTTVGSASDEDAALVRASAQALDDAVAAARPGGRLGDLGHAIGVVGRSAGYGLPAELAGHGIGRQRREAPSVPNEGSFGRGAPLRPGMVLAIEPVLLAGGSDELRTDQDGWTLRTGDGSRAAHVGHTVAITGRGPQVLTRP